jgi:hypothetical protein
MSDPERSAKMNTPLKVFIAVIAFASSLTAKSIDDATILQLVKDSDVIIVGLLGGSAAGGGGATSAVTVTEILLAPKTSITGKSIAVFWPTSKGVYLSDIQKSEMIWFLRPHDSLKDGFHDVTDFTLHYPATAENRELVKKYILQKKSAHQAPQTR